MKLFIGTSGWAYKWFPKATLNWYVENSGMNTIELNSSFYYYPKPSSVENWKTIGKDLSWAIKVHRGITHISRMKEDTHKLFNRMLELFSPMEKIITYYLFQFPPTFRNNPENIERINNFLRAFPEIKTKFAFEFRNSSWFNKDIESLIADNGSVFVSVDAPGKIEIPYDITCSKKRIYKRMHGRVEWFQYNYSREELREIADNILAHDPDICHIFFNNDFDMLPNANMMKDILNGEKTVEQKKLF
jgi:uncharacterized protein YecE (DUF72 family)